LYNDGYESDRVDDHCTMCGCTITRKTASLSSNCGISCCNETPENECSCKKKALKKYNTENKINLELKWKAYKKETNE